jgi:hypothetical protein
MEPLPTPTPKKVSTPTPKKSVTCKHSERDTRLRFDMFESRFNELELDNATVWDKLAECMEINRGLTCTIEVLKEQQTTTANQVELFEEFRVWRTQRETLWNGVEENTVTRMPRDHTPDLSNIDHATFSPVRATTSRIPTSPIAIKVTESALSPISGSQNLIVVTPDIPTIGTTLLPETTQTSSSIQTIEESFAALATGCSGLS